MLGEQGVWLWRQKSGRKGELTLLFDPVFIIVGWAWVMVGPKEWWAGDWIRGIGVGLCLD